MSDYIDTSHVYTFLHDIYTSTPGKKLFALEGSSGAAKTWGAIDFCLEYCRINSFENKVYKASKVFRVFKAFKALQEQLVDKASKVFKDFRVSKAFKVLVVEELAVDLKDSKVQLEIIQVLLL